MSLVSQGTFYRFVFYFTSVGSKCHVAALKRLTVHLVYDIYLNFDHAAHSKYIFVV